MLCEFSETIVATSASYSRPSISFESVRNSLLLTINGSRLTIRSVDSHTVLHIFSCIDKIDLASLSPDGEYVMCAMYPRAAIQVFSLTDPDWNCRINEGVAGLVKSSWCPDSRHILTESDFGLQICVWSLVDSSSMIISNPKSMATGTGAITRGTAFSDCGNYLAVIHRIELQDYLGIYSTNPWEELTKFRCQSSDAMFVSWLPGGLHLIVLDSPLNYRLTVYSPSGELLANYVAYEHALGIRSLAFPKSGTNFPTAMMAVASFDGKVRLLSARSWSEAYVLLCGHPKDMDATLVPQDENGLIYVEEGAILNEGSTLGSSRMLNQSQFQSQSQSLSLTLRKQPVKLPETSFTRRHIKTLPKIIIDPLKLKGPPAMGVNWISFSSNGSYLAAREESHPRCLWLWDVTTVHLAAILIQVESIVSAAWRPSTADSSDHSSILAYCTGTERVYFWNSSRGPSWYDLPTDKESSPPFAVMSIHWNSDGTKLILSGKDSFCICSVRFDSSEGIFQERREINPILPITRDQPLRLEEMNT